MEAAQGLHLFFLTMKQGLRHMAFMQLMQPKQLKAEVGHLAAMHGISRSSSSLELLSIYTIIEGLEKGPEPIKLSA